MPRRKVCEIHWLTISAVTADFSSFVGAKLIDVSAGGFGYPRWNPYGAVAEEIQVDKHWMKISGPPAGPQECSGANAGGCGQPGPAGQSSKQV
ncbi:MAG TPA: hypothetical protein VML01_07515 [Bryobacterales bacterium]|nr:hypothetical protein [Bryobacterales bacterium]